MGLFQAPSSTSINQIAFSDVASLLPRNCLKIWIMRAAEDISRPNRRMSIASPDATETENAL